MKKSMYALKATLLTFVLALAVPLAAHAATYYIATSGSDSNPGTITSPWKTFTKANSTLAAGDTVYVRAGTYSSNGYVNPANSGSSSAHITYAGYPGETATVTGQSYGVYIVKSYITVKDLNFTNANMEHMYIGGGSSSNPPIGVHDIDIIHCNFDNYTAIGWSGSKIWQSSYNVHVLGCRFSDYGDFSHSNTGTVLDIGYENTSNSTTQTSDNTHNILIEQSTFYHGGHHVVGFYGNHIVFRNNWAHNEYWKYENGVWQGDRVLYTQGANTPAKDTQNLYEFNKISYGSSNQYVPASSGFSMDNHNNIVRNNWFFGSYGMGIALTCDSTSGGYTMCPSNNRIFNNSFYGNGNGANADAYAAATGANCNNGSYSCNNNAWKNNIYSGSPTDYKFSSYASSGNQVMANNWGVSNGNPLFVDTTGVFDTDGNNNGAMSTTKPDLRLQSGSPCLNHGGALTTVTSAAGSGTQFTVADASYFIDGWGIVSGDTIRLVGSSTTAKITSISGNTITVDTSISWTSGQGVALNYTGSAPDQGAAFPSSGYGQDAYEAGLPTGNGGSAPAPTATKPSAPTNLTVS